MLIYLTVNLKYICFIYIYSYMKIIFFLLSVLQEKCPSFFCSVFKLKMFKDCECVIFEIGCCILL